MCSCCPCQPCDPCSGQHLSAQTTSRWFSALQYPENSSLLSQAVPAAIKSLWCRVRKEYFSLWAAIECLSSVWHIYTNRQFPSWLRQGCLCPRAAAFGEKAFSASPLSHCFLWTGGGCGLYFSPCYSEPIMKNGLKSILRRKKCTLCNNFWTMRRGFENRESEKRWEGWSSSSRLGAACHILGKNTPQMLLKIGLQVFFWLSTAPQSGTEDWESLEHLQWAQQRVLTAECSWCLESSPEFSRAPSWSTDLKQSQVWETGWKSTWKMRSLCLSTLCFCSFRNHSKCSSLFFFLPPHCCSV